MNSSRRWLPLLLLLLPLLAVGGCSAPHDPAAPATPPPASAPSDIVTDPSCPAQARLEAVPKRVVTLDAGAAAFLIALGVGDTIVGTAAPTFKADFRGELREELDAIAVLDEGQGSAEAVIAAAPDLVTGISAYEFGGFDGTASVEQLAAAGSAALSACSAVRDGPVVDIDETFRYITALAAAFGVPERGDGLIADLRARIPATDDSATAEPVSVLTLSSVPDAGTGITTHGGSSFTNGVISLAGGRNVAIDQPQDFVNLSAEAVALADPQVIVIVSGFSRADDADLTSAILASPLLAGTRAVTSGNVVTVAHHILVSPSLLNTDAIEIVRDAVARAR